MSSKEITRPPSSQRPFHVARSLYGQAFDPASRDEIGAAIRDWRTLSSSERSFALCHLLYLNLQAQAQGVSLLEELVDTLGDIDDAVQDMADELFAEEDEGEKTDGESTDDEAVADDLVEDDLVEEGESAGDVTDDRTSSRTLQQASVNAATDRVAEAEMSKDAQPVLNDGPDRAPLHGPPAQDSLSAEVQDQRINRTLAPLLATHEAPVSARKGRGRSQKSGSVEPLPAGKSGKQTAALTTEESTHE